MKAPAQHDPDKLPTLQRLQVHALEKNASPAATAAPPVAAPPPPPTTTTVKAQISRAPPAARAESTLPSQSQTTTSAELTSKRVLLCNQSVDRIYCSLENNSPPSPFCYWSVNQSNGTPTRFSPFQGHQPAERKVATAHCRLSKANPVTSAAYLRCAPMRNSAGAAEQILLVRPPLPSKGSSTYRNFATIVAQALHPRRRFARNAGCGDYTSQQSWTTGEPTSVTRSKQGGRVGLESII